MLKYIFQRWVFNDLSKEKRNQCGCMWIKLDLKMKKACGNTSGSTSYNYAYLLFYSSEFIIPTYRQESSSRCSSSHRCSQGGRLFGWTSEIYCFRGFSGPDECWAPLGMKNFSPPRTYFWLRACKQLKEVWSLPLVLLLERSVTIFKDWLCEHHQGRYG